MYTNLTTWHESFRIFVILRIQNFYLKCEITYNWHTCSSSYVCDVIEWEKENPSTFCDRVHYWQFNDFKTSIEVEIFCWLSHFYMGRFCRERYLLYLNEMEWIGRGNVINNNRQQLLIKTEEEDGIEWLRHIYDTQKTSKPWRKIITTRHERR